MPYFAKTPVMIEARQYDGSAESAERIAEWISSCGGWVETAEGMSPGDWVIKQPAGQFYALNPELFRATYSPLPVTQSKAEVIS